MALALFHLSSADSFTSSFTSYAAVLDCPDGLRGRIVDRFQIPSFLLNRVCRESNGFSGCEQAVNDDGPL